MPLFFFPTAPHFAFGWFTCRREPVANRRDLEVYRLIRISPEDTTLRGHHRKRRLTTDGGVYRAKGASERLYVRFSCPAVVWVFGARGRRPRGGTCGQSRSNRSNDNLRGHAIIPSSTSELRDKASDDFNVVRQGLCNNDSSVKVGSLHVSPHMSVSRMRRVFAVPPNRGDLSTGFLHWQPRAPRKLIRLSGGFTMR